MIVSYAACAVYIAGLLLAGYSIVGWMMSGSRLEIFGFSACVGPGIFGLILIALSMFGFQPNGWMTGIITLLALAASTVVFRFRKNKYPPAQFEPLSRIWLVIGVIALGYCISVVFYDAVVLPPIEWDAFAIWQFKSKILLDHALVPKPAYFFDPTLSYSHQRYPILWPMISTGLRTWLGSGHDELAKSPALLFFAGLGALIFGTIRRLRGTEAAIGSTLLLLTLPVMLQFAGTGIADLPLTAFYAGSIICILRWQQERKWPDLILAAIFTAAMCWTKNEGAALAVINALAVLLFSLGHKAGCDFSSPSPGTPGEGRGEGLAPLPMDEQPSPPALSRSTGRGGQKTILAFVVFATIAFLIFLPWMRYVIEIPKTDEDYAGRLTSTLIFQRLSGLPAILGMILREFASPDDWGFFWYAIIALSIYKFRSLFGRPIATLWFQLLAQMAVYMAAFLVTNWDVSLLIPTTLHRLILHTTPAAALILGLQWPGRKSEIRNSKSERNPK